MRQIQITTILLITVLVFPVVLTAQLAQSAFETDADGWLSVTLPYPHATPISILATNSPLWQAGGYLKLDDPDGSGQTGNVQYWLSPAKFVGAKGAAYGGRLSFDLRNQGSSFGPFSQEDVILVGGGLTLVYQLTNSPSQNVFTHYIVPLTATGWKRDSLTGPAATPAELQSALSALSRLFIRAEYQLGPDTEYLDNVILCAVVPLNISTAGTNVVLSWSQSACDAVLERSDLLGSAAVWSPEGSLPVVIGNDFAVTNGVTGTSRFYRLRFP